MVDNAPIIIVGTGLAGYSLAREFRKLEPAKSLTLISADDGCYYSKPMLSNAFKNSQDPVSLAMNDVATMASQLNAEILPSARVEALQPEPRNIIVDGKPLAYDKLVLALGADPIRIPVEGDAQDRIFAVNDLSDYSVFRTAIADAKRVVIMGAGLIGCEFANDLNAAGIHADVVDPAAWPVNRFLPEAAGRALQTALADVGVVWHFGTAVDSLDRNAARVTATLKNGDRIDADAVLSAIGLRPRTQLASDAGLATQRGIVVNRHLATSVANTYALGDCAEVEGLVLPFIMPIMHAARALAKTLTGTPTEVRYPAMPVVVKTPSYPVVVNPPNPGVDGDWEVDVQPEGVRALYYDAQHVLQGFALTGTCIAEKNTLAKQAPPVLG